MYLITFLKECEIAKYQADPKTIALTSANRKHKFAEGEIVSASMVNTKNDFIELHLLKPINNYRRFYIPSEYEEYIKITFIDSVSHHRTA